MNLQTRLLLSIGIALLIIFSIIETRNYYTAKKNAEYVLWEQAEKVRNVLMSVRRIYHKQFLSSGIELTEKTVGFLPAHALGRISQDYHNWDTSEFSFENVSDQPRNPEHMADATELAAMAYFRQHPDDQTLFKSFYQPSGEKFYLYARPIWVEKYCLECHGKKSEAPPAIQAMYDTAYNYNEGDLRGVLSIKLPAAAMDARIWAMFWQNFTIHLIGFIAIFILVSIIIRRYVTDPLQGLTQGMQAVSVGNYGYQVDDYQGEFGLLSNTFNNMTSQITEQREKLNALNHQLEQKIQERTEALKLAEAANHAKSEFLANMSHELRTPLNAILGYAQIFVRETNLTPKQQEGIGIVKHSGEHLLTLINDILDLSKIESGHIELDPADIHLDSFLQKAVQVFEMRAQQKGVAFIFEKMGTLPEGIQADEKRLRQILINVLGNAVKFTKHGGITFKVSYHQETLVFEIEDTGVGIDSEEFGSIFQPFQQAGDKYFRPEGTGLGLAITQRLIKLMDGTLKLDSTLGKGTIVFIELPLPIVENVEAPIQAVKPSVVGFKGTAQKIIVSDDKWENRSVVAHLLTDLGFEVFEASDGQECLDLLHKVDPDLIITDLVMPIIDGFETLRRIRKAGLTIPVIASSASIFEFDKQRSFESGFDAFLEKPIHVDDLLNDLHTFLDIEWVYEQRPEQHSAEEETKVMSAKAGEEPESEAESDLATQEVIPREEANTIFDLAKLGDVKELQTELNKLRLIAPHLADKLYKLADNFETDEVAEIVEKYLS
ncbi:DUF3365 domain-containing protein [Candidatus Albibeggiatoa sp. nov. NOAA]|uniref:c-type heme family protein n=1 Tax=Candidatus Albibeggiatoa sp. nov. NOAA TaxID=3162724 RepID=UPI0032FFC747|nr:DUF3365 domain-containing protein [Thiotrichaceae bacterium]